MNFMLTKIFLTSLISIQTAEPSKKLICLITKLGFPKGVFRLKTGKKETH